VLEHHFQILQDYEPRAYPGPVTLLRARAQALCRLQGRDLGWGELTGSAVRVLTLAGSHDTLLKEPYVRALATRLRGCLRHAQAISPERTSRPSPAPGADPGSPGETVRPEPAESEVTGVERVWKVVANQEGQYSLWPADGANPPGWRDVGQVGTADACQAYIRAEWTDLRPLSLLNAPRRASDVVPQDQPFPRLAAQLP
jgi:MbtH protein